MPNPFQPYLAADSRYERMMYRRCGNSGLKLPAISLGLWHNFGGVDTIENARQILRRAFDLGITHFDLANNYGPPPGSAEETFGKIFAQDFKRYRAELIVSSKAGWGMWPGHMVISAHVSTWLPVLTRVCEGWGWIMSIFSTTIDLIPEHLLRRR